MRFKRFSGSPRNLIYRNLNLKTQFPNFKLKTIGIFTTFIHYGPYLELRMCTIISLFFFGTNWWCRKCLHERMRDGVDKFSLYWIIIKNANNLCSPELLLLPGYNNIILDVLSGLKNYPCMLNEEMFQTDQMIFMPWLISTKIIILP